MKKNKNKKNTVDEEEASKIGIWCQIIRTAKGHAHEEL